jgi:hypothetical protein
MPPQYDVQGVIPRWAPLRRVISCNSDAIDSGVKVVRLPLDNGSLRMETVRNAECSEVVDPVQFIVAFHYRH